MVRLWQDLFYKKRYSSVRLSSPDFAALARSFGAAGFRARTPDEARAALQAAFAASGTALIDFNVTEEENVYPIVPPGAGHQEMILPE